MAENYDIFDGFYHDDGSPLAVDEYIDAVLIQDDFGVFNHRVVRQGQWARVLGYGCYHYNQAAGA